MARGRDYQDCPKCQVRITLRDGCNYVHCVRCTTGFCFCFCFCCGEVAAHSSNHWLKGNPCPKWNYPGLRNALDALVIHEAMIVRKPERLQSELDLQIRVLVIELRIRIRGSKGKGWAPWSILSE